MPAANQARFPALRIRSTGLGHAVGAGESRSWISKSPSGASGTPVAGVLCALNVMGVVLSAHSSVTKTLAPALKPMLSPPASSKPRPFTPMLPSVFTVASRSRMAQGWPAGCTPRTMLRFTTAAVGAMPTPLETGMTPMPPLNFASVLSASADDASRTRTVRSERAMSFMTSSRCVVDGELVGETLRKRGRRGEGSGVDYVIVPSALFHQTVKLPGVLAGDLPHDVGRQMAELLLDVLRGFRPDAVSVRIIRGPHQRLDAHLVDHLRADAIELERRLALPAPVIARLHRQTEITEAVLPLEVHAIERVGDPADAALAEDDAQVGIALEHGGTDERRQDVDQVHLKR